MFKKIVSIIMCAMCIFCTFVCMAYASNTDYDESIESLGVNPCEWEVLKLTNKDRFAVGLQPLSLSPALQPMCDEREREIVDSFSHYDAKGNSIYEQKIRANKYEYSSCGENIASGFCSPDAVNDGWMNSPGHKANILRNSFTHLGVGYNDEHKTWVQIFAGLCDIDSMRIEGSNSLYKKGTPVSDFTNYIVITCRQHGKSYIPIDESMVTGYNSEKLGEQTLTVSYKREIANNNNVIIQDGLIYNIRQDVTAKYQIMTASFTITVCDEGQESVVKDKPESLPTSYLRFPDNTSASLALLAIEIKFPDFSKCTFRGLDGNLITDGGDLLGTGFIFECHNNDDITERYYIVVSGDMNGDGHVTAADARAILRISASLDDSSPLMITAGDVSGDEKITAADARTVLRVAAGLQHL